MRTNIQKKTICITLGIAIIFIMSFINCKKEESKTSLESGKQKDSTSLSGVILFSVGEITSQGKKLKVGDIVYENAIVQVGKKSICDIQIKETESEVVMRLKSESTLQLQISIVNGKKIPSPFISAGTAMINVSGKLKKDDNFQIITPTTVAGVRGTKFEVNVDKDGSTSIIVAEGKVGTRLRLTEAEDLPFDIQEKSHAISSIKKSLEAQEQIIEAGQRIEIQKSESDNLLKKSGLSETIKAIHLNSESTPNAEEIQVAVNSLDKKEESIAIENKIKTSDTRILKKVSNIASGDLQEKLKEFNELIAIEKQKLEGTETTITALKDRNEKNQEILIKRIEAITGKTFETMILKSGKKIKGIIFLEGNNYFVITPDGQETYKEEEVEGMEL